MPFALVLERSSSCFQIMVLIQNFRKCGIITRSIIILYFPGRHSLDILSLKYLLHIKYDCFAALRLFSIGGFGWRQSIEALGVGRENNIPELASTSAYASVPAAVKLYDANGYLTNAGVVNERTTRTYGQLPQGLWHNVQSKRELQRAPSSSIWWLPKKRS